MNLTPHVIILLSYKGKALLMHKQKGVLDPEKHPWSFITGVLDKNESFEKALSKKIQKEMGIKINNIEFIEDFYYHARLSDENVNSIKRSEHQLLDFFTLKETEKLFLSPSTKDFIQKHGQILLDSHPGFDN